MRHSIALCWLIVGLLLAGPGMTLAAPTQSVLAQSATEKAVVNPGPLARGFPLNGLQMLTEKTAGQIIPLARLGRGRVNSLTWSPDAKKLVVGSSTGVWLYASDHLDGEPDSFAELVAKVVSNVALSPDGKLMATGNYDRSVHLWDIQTGHAIATLQGPDDGFHAETQVAFSPDGKLLAFSSGWDRDAHVQLWDVHAKRAVANLWGHTDYITSLAFSPDGKLLASGADNYDNTVRIWDVKSGLTAFVLSGYSRAVYGLAFSPDGKLLAATTKGSVRITDMLKRQTIANLKSSGSDTTFLASLSFSADGKLLASGSFEGLVQIWNVQSGQVITTLHDPTGEISDVAFSPDGKLLAFGSGDSGDSSVQVWDVQHQTIAASLHGYTEDLTSMTFSPDGKLLASGLSGKTVRLWSVQSGQTVATLQVAVDTAQVPVSWATVNGLAFSPDGRLLASGNEDHTMQLWNIQTGQIVTSSASYVGTIEGVAFSPDGKILASGGMGGAVRLTDIQSGQTLIAVQDDPTKRWNGGLNGIAFSPDGKWVAAAYGQHQIMGGDNDTVWVWDAQSGQVLATLTGHKETVMSVAFSPDGKLLASGSWDRSVQLWDVQSGQTVTTLQASSDIFSVAFSPDGKLLAAGTRDNSVQLWSVQSGKLLASLKSHSDIVDSVAFSADGTLLASGSHDGSIVLWGVPGQ